MGDYSNQGYPPPPPQGTPTPAPAPQPGFDWGSLLQQLAPANAIPSLLHFLVPGVSGLMDQVANDQAIRRAQTIGIYAHLAQSPEFNAMLYGQYPKGIPPSPWPTVPATGGAPGGAGGGPFPGAPGGPPPGLRPEDQNRLQLQGPSTALPGYHPTNYPGPGMPPRVLTQEDTKTQLNSAEAEAWRRYNAGGAAGTSNVPPYAPPVIYAGGDPRYPRYLVNQHQDSHGQWLNTYSDHPAVRQQTGDVAAATNPLAHPDTHGQGPPLQGGNQNQGGPPPPVNQGGQQRTTPKGNALAGKGFEWKTGDGQVHSGIVDPDGMHIVSPDGASGVIAIQPDGSYAVIEGELEARTGPNNTSTTSTPTTTSTSTTRQLGTTTSQPPRMLTTTTTQPPSTGGAVAAPGASGGAPPAPSGGAQQGGQPASPDMQLLDSIPLPPTAATTQTPTTSQPPTTGAPQTATTQTPTTSQPPSTSAFPLGPPTTTPPTLPPGVTPPVSNFPLGPNPPRPEQGAGGSAFPLGPGARTGSPSPAFQPTGEAAGAQAGVALGGGTVQGAIQPAGGTAPGAETQPEPSILARAAGALGPSEAQAGGPPGGPGAAPAPAPTETQTVPEENPSEPVTVLQPSQQRDADISQAIARNTNGIQNYIRKTYPQYPKMFDIPPSVRQADGVLQDAGAAIARAREVDMAAARAQATPERRAQLDAANNAYNRLWLFYRTPIGPRGLTGLDASLPNADQPGVNRFILESGPFTKELSEHGGPIGWVGGLGHAMSRSGAGFPNAPDSLESVEQMKGRGGEEGQAATNFLQGHTVAIPIARALGASGRVNQRELALIQQYLIPSPDTFFDSNYQKLQNTLDTLDAIRRGYAVDPGKTGMVLMTGPDGVPHLVEAGGGDTSESGPQMVTKPGETIGPAPRQIGR